MLHYCTQNYKWHTSILLLFIIIHVLINNTELVWILNYIKQQQQQFWNHLTLSCQQYACVHYCRWFMLIQYKSIIVKTFARNQEVWCAMFMRSSWKHLCCHLNFRVLPTSWKTLHCYECSLSISEKSINTANNKWLFSNRSSHIL